jgi:nitroimidazol reductase NimA-like FMN-containing flavoprotein (pyridoxamine 5'-phosphate oxidase superfamily)
MKKDSYLNRPPHQVRREDRAVSDEDWIRTFLDRAPYGVLAYSYEGQPFVNSNLFVFDEQAHAIYLHTAHVGRTRSTLEIAGQVCFSVSAMGRLLPAEEALEFSVEFAGVTVFGNAAVIKEETEKAYALQRLLDKYFTHLRPGKDYRPITSEELARTSVYRVAIDSWSGKRKEVDENFPGAFAFHTITPPYFQG